VERALIRIDTSDLDELAPVGTSGTRPEHRDVESPCRDWHINII
jgi:hypothetical protein